MPIDLTSLALLAGLFFGAVIGDAALFGDPLRVQMGVPTELNDAGFTEQAAEQIFANEVAEIGQVLSVVPTPSVEVSTSPSIFAAIAKPLNLEDLVVTLQRRAGRDVVEIDGHVMRSPDGKGLVMMISAVKPGELPISVLLQQPDGNPVVLVQRASKEVLARLSPYRVALTEFAALLRGDKTAMGQVREVAEAALARPWTPHRATERVMLYNLLGVTALIEGDIAGAQQQFDRGLESPGGVPAARAGILLNRGFVALVQRRSDEALAYYKQALAESRNFKLAGYESRMATTAALIAWAMGDTRQAEDDLRLAVTMSPDNHMAYYYLARLLEAKGDGAGAAAMRRAAAALPRFDLDFPGLAISELMLDPLSGGLDLRPR